MRVNVKVIPFSKMESQAQNYQLLKHLSLSIFALTLKAKKVTNPEIKSTGNFISGV